VPPQTPAVPVPLEFPPEAWAGFLLVVLVLLALDLFVVHRKAHAVPFREAAAWSVVWILLALAFNGWVWWRFGRGPALDFLQGYLVEEALSIDNLFVFLTIFSFFRVPADQRHRVLFWGILGALVMRGLFVWAGVELLQRFQWLFYLLGGFLVWTGFKLLTGEEAEFEPEKSFAFRAVRRVVPMVPEYERGRFLVRRDGRLLGTPLLLVLVLIEATDVVFAVDSVPAVLAITQEPFIVYTSNVFAILGLRALFFVLAGMLGRLPGLKVGISLVLVFVGAKMVLHHHLVIPSGVSLGAIAALLFGSWLVATVVRRREGGPPAVPAPPAPGGDAGRASGGDGG